MSVLAQAVMETERPLTARERLRLVEIAAGATDPRVREAALTLLEGERAAMALGAYAPIRDRIRQQQAQGTIDPPQGVRPVPRYAAGTGEPGAESKRALDGVSALVRGHAPDLEPDGLASRGG